MRINLDYFKNISDDKYLALIDEFINYGKKGTKEERVMDYVADNVMKNVFIELISGICRNKLNKSIELIEISDKKNIDLIMQAVKVYMDMAQKVNNLSESDAEYKELVSSLLKIGRWAYNDDRLLNIDYYTRDIYEGVIYYVASDVIKYGNIDSKETLYKMMFYVFLCKDYPNSLLNTSGKILNNVMLSVLL